MSELTISNRRYPSKATPRYSEPVAIANLNDDVVIDDDGHETLAAAYARQNARIERAAYKIYES